MCLQCMTEAEIFANSLSDVHILPGYALMRATKDDYPDDPGWKKGEYGLVRMNDPDIVFDIKPMKKPYKYGDDDKMNTEKDHQKYFDEVCKIQDRLDDMTFTDIASLIEAINKVYGHKFRNSFDVAHILMDLIYNWTQSHHAKSIDEWECIVRGITMEEWEKFKKEIESRNEQTRTKNFT